MVRRYEYKVVNTVGCATWDLFLIFFILFTKARLARMVALNRHTPVANRYAIHPWPCEAMTKLRRFVFSAIGLQQPTTCYG